MRASSLFFMAASVPWLLCSCSSRSSAEDSEDADLEEGVATFEALDERPESPTIDSTFTIIEDLTADGEPDSLELRVFGPRMDDPFSWTVRIWVRGELVFEHEAVDSYQDQFFGDPEYMVPSRGREQDKASYYFEYLPSNLFHRVQRGAGAAIFDRNSVAGVYQVVAREVHERGMVDEETVQEIIEQVVERLQAGTVVLMMPINPFISGFPSIYIAELGEFVPFVVW